MQKNLSFQWILLSVKYTMYWSQSRLIRALYDLHSEWLSSCPHCLMYTKRPCANANKTGPCTLTEWITTFLIWIQAARTFDGWHGSMAAADADVKYIQLHVLKYAGWNPEDTDPAEVSLTLFKPNIGTVWKPFNGPVTVWEELLINWRVFGFWLDRIFFLDHHPSMIQTPHTEIL